MSSSVYRCPICKHEPIASDKTKSEGSNIVRSIVYECGTVKKIIQNAYRFKENIEMSEKCSESITVAM